MMIPEHRGNLFQYALKASKLSFIMPHTQCDQEGGVMLAYHVWMDEDTRNDRRLGYSKSSFFLATRYHMVDVMIGSTYLDYSKELIILEPLES